MTANNEFRYNYMPSEIRCPLQVFFLFRVKKGIHLSLTCQRARFVSFMRAAYDFAAIFFFLQFNIIKYTMKCDSIEVI